MVKSKIKTGDNHELEREREQKLTPLNSRNIKITFLSTSDEIFLEVSLKSVKRQEEKIKIKKPEMLKEVGEVDGMRTEDYLK